MNISVESSAGTGRDPLGLRDLGQLDPEAGSAERDWAAVSSALEAANRRRRQAWLGSLAMAASIILVIALLVIPGQGREPGPVREQLSTQHQPQQTGTQADAIAAPGLAHNQPQPTTRDLIGMSQSMERQLRLIRSQVGTMPSSLVVYQVELQDLIGQVDDALSLSPDSRELWGQRLELQMDLMKLYRNQLRRDYHRLASV